MEQLRLRRHNVDSDQQAKLCNLNILLLGKTGVGKSATGNTILGENRFNARLSPETTTKVSESKKKVRFGREITVIDTPGIYSTSMTADQWKREIERCFTLCRGGLDAILLVIKLGDRFTEENKRAIQWIEENFGEQALRNTIVLFTWGDQLEQSIDQYMKGQSVRMIVDQCFSTRVFNNKSNNEEQVTGLLECIDMMKMNNRRRIYSEDEYRKVQRILRRNRFAVYAGVGGAVAGGAGGAGVAGTAVVASASVLAKVGLVAAGAVGGAAVGGVALAGAVIFAFFAREP